MGMHLVLFDLDGTLVDCAGAGRRAIEAAFREVLGLPDIEAPASRVRFEGKTDPVIVEEIAREAGIPEARLLAVEDAFRASYLAALRNELARPSSRRRIMPGVRELLGALEAREDVRLGLLTGNIEAGARAKLEPFGLNRYFASGGFSSDHRDRAEIARVAHEKLARLAGESVPPQRVSVIGDTELDVFCARANGFRAIAVHSGWVSRERLEAARPDALFDDLSDLPAVLAALGLHGGREVVDEGARR
jgi:phosphoglycolate phosphatase-like HAD superfamily hydrolase